MAKSKYSEKSPPLRLTKTGPSVTELAARFKLQPPRPELFAEALTHSSYANEHQLTSNERLEFLGDSVLSLISSNLLFHHFSGENEGYLAKLKSIIISAPVLAGFAQELELERFLRLGEGELKSSGKNKRNILADLFEAFIGAFFLNFGLEQTTGFVEPLFMKALPGISSKLSIIDSKTHLQELVQARGLKPEYRTIKAEGPPHNRVFTVEVIVAELSLGKGSGRSLKEAQHQAAINAIAAWADHPAFSSI